MAGSHEAAPLAYESALTLGTGKEMLWSIGEAVLTDATFLTAEKKWIKVLTKEEYEKVLSQAASSRRIPYPFVEETPFLGQEPDARGMALQVMQRDAFQLAGLTITQDAQGLHINGLQLSWYTSASGARVQGSLLSADAGVPPANGSHSISIPPNSRLLHIEVTAALHPDSSIRMEAVELAWLTFHGAARSRKAFCDGHLGMSLPREKARYAFDPCDVVLGMRSYPAGNPHLSHVSLLLGRHPHGITYSDFSQQGHPPTVLTQSKVEDQVSVMPSGKGGAKGSTTHTFTYGHSQAFRITEKLQLPPFVCVNSLEGSDLSFTVVNSASKDLTNVRLASKGRGLRGERIWDHVHGSFDLSLDFTDQATVSTMTSDLITRGAVRGTCVATLHWQDFHGRAFSARLRNVPVTIDQIHARIGRRVKTVPFREEGIAMDTEEDEMYVTVAETGPPQ